MNGRRMNSNDMLGEIRNPKSEIRRESEARNPNSTPEPRADSSEFGSRPSLGFRISDFGFLSALFLAALVVSGCHKKREGPSALPPELPAAQVRVQTAANRTQPITEEVVGTVRAKLRATLEAKLNGRIETLPVVLGQQVKEGQLLARLDAREIKARLDQAEATLEQADRDWKRISALLAGQAATRAEADAAEARQRVAKAAAAEAQTMLSYVEIHAPFDGVVAKKWADTGDLAVPGKPLLDLEAQTGLQMEADVPEAIAARVQRDQKLAVRVEAVAGELTGVVSELAPAADPASRTFRVKLDLDAAKTTGVRAGQFARLRVPVGESNALHVPTSAVVQRGQLEIVFVVTDQHAHLRLVKTGKRSGDEIEILSGLHAGESVVVEGAALLLDGQAVK
jgi:RND family efflux transporter MFP subunit